MRRKEHALRIRSLCYSKQSGVGYYTNIYIIYIDLWWLHIAWMVCGQIRIIDQTLLTRSVNLIYSWTGNFHARRRGNDEELGLGAIWSQWHLRTARQGGSGLHCNVQLQHATRNRLAVLYITTGPSTTDPHANHTESRLELGRQIRVLQQSLVDHWWRQRTHRIHRHAKNGVFTRRYFASGSHELLSSDRIWLAGKSRLDPFNFLLTLN